jgi:hypothetical protein
MMISLGQLEVILALAPGASPASFMAVAEAGAYCALLGVALVPLQALTMAARAGTDTNLSKCFNELISIRKPWGS